MHASDVKRCGALGVGGGCHALGGGAERLQEERPQAFELFGWIRLD